MAASVGFLKTMVYATHSCYYGLTKGARKQHWIESMLAGGFHKDDVVLPKLPTMSINGLCCYSVGDFAYWLTHKWKPYALSGTGPIVRLKSDLAMSTVSEIILSALNYLCESGSWRSILLQPPQRFVMPYELRLCVVVGVTWFVKNYRNDLLKAHFGDESYEWTQALRCLESELPNVDDYSDSRHVEQRTFIEESIDSFKSNQQQMIKRLEALSY